MSEITENAKSAGADEAGGGRYDAVIVGAGTAGFSAALVLGRSRRRVLVLDGGEPRNAPSAGARGFFTRDGVSPAELLKIGREQLEPYGGVEYRAVGAAYAPGDAGSPTQQIALAASSGASAAAFLNHVLCNEDAEVEALSAADAAGGAVEEAAGGGLR